MAIWARRLDLEHADRVGAAQHVVDVVLLRDGGQVDLVAAVLADEVDGVVQRAEHAQAEQVELHQPDRGAVVLVPLQHAALLHPPPLDRADLDHRPVADHHPAGVDAEVARDVLDLLGQLEHGRGDVVIGLMGGGRHVAPGVDLLAPRVLLARRVAERLGHVAHRRPGPVGDDVGDLGGVMAAVALVHVLDDLFAPVALDVDVDVGRAVTFRREEPLEQQAERHGVGLGDAEGVAHRAVRRAAPALAEDVGAIAELDEVPHDEEVAGEPELLDHVELVVDGRPGPGAQRQVFVGAGTLAVAAAATLLDEAAQVLHLAERRAVGPGGHGNGGRFGATSARSNAAARPISAAASTTPG